MNGVNEFKREDRYIVIKRSDLKKVPVAYCSHLVDPMLSLLSHLPHRQCVVIESDWPEYNFVWLMLEHRMAGCPVPDFNAVKCAADVQVAQSELAALREELATAKRNEHNSEVAYKAAIERQEELRNELDRIKTISYNNFSIATDRYFALKAAEQRNADIEKRAVDLVECLWGLELPGAGNPRLRKLMRALEALKPTELGASE